MPHRKIDQHKAQSLHFTSGEPSLRLEAREKIKLSYHSGTSAIYLQPSWLKKWYKIKLHLSKTMNLIPSTLNKTNTLALPQPMTIEATHTYSFFVLHVINILVVAPPDVPFIFTNLTESETRNRQILMQQCGGIAGLVAVVQGEVHFKVAAVARPRPAVWRGVSALHRAACFAEIFVQGT